MQSSGVRLLPCDMTKIQPKGPISTAIAAVQRSQQRARPALSSGVLLHITAQGTHIRPRRRAAAQTDTPEYVPRWA